MAPENFLASKASEAVKALYGADVPATGMQVCPTRKEFEGDLTLVVFPLLRVSHASPEATGQTIGGWLVQNCPEIASFGVVKGFLNVCLSGTFWSEELCAIAADPDFGTLPSTGIRETFPVASSVISSR